jgi:hypothetical protein
MKERPIGLWNNCYTNLSLSYRPLNTSKVFNHLCRRNSTKAFAERLLSMIDKNQISNAVDCNLSKGRVECTISIYIHDLKARAIIMPWRCNMGRYFRFDIERMKFAEDTDKAGSSQLGELVFPRGNQKKLSYFLPENLGTIKNVEKELSF